MLANLQRIKSATIKFKPLPGMEFPIVYIILSLGLRPKIWKYLLKYALIHATEDTLNKKRNEYQTLVNNYWKPESFN